MTFAEVVSSHHPASHDEEKDLELSSTTAEAGLTEVGLELLPVFFEESSGRQSRGRSGTPGWKSEKGEEEETHRIVSGFRASPWQVAMLSDLDAALR